MYKAYARPEPDVSIEREMTAHLTKGGYRATPKLLAALRFTRKINPETVSLLFEFVKSQGDGGVGCSRA